MHTIGQLLNAKGSDIWSIEPEETVYSALQLMAEKNIGAVLVIDNGKLVGIFSERDYARKVILEGKSSKDTAVGELMTRKIFYINPKNRLEECMALMTFEHVRHVPVLENDRLIGIVSIGDVIKQIISEQAFRIQSLEKYITGSL